MKLEEIKKKEAGLFDPEIFGFSEFVSGELNELQNEKIRQLKWKKIVLYNVNKNKVKEWKGETLLNFSWDFALKTRNRKIIQLMEKLQNAPLKEIYDIIDDIFDTAERARAVFFYWS